MRISRCISRSASGERLPGENVRKEKQMSTRHTVIDTALLGPVTIVATGSAVTGVYFRHHIRRAAPEALGPAVSSVDAVVLGEAVNQLLMYLLGQRRAEEPATVRAGRLF
jgi:methylated-DNA-[protein]-cysteine S-methyltransferase